MGAWVIRLGSINLCKMCKTLLGCTLRPIQIEDVKIGKVFAGCKMATDLIIPAYNHSKDLSVDNSVKLCSPFDDKVTNKKRLFSP